MAQRPEIGLGIDVGTTFTSYSIRQNGKTTSGRFPADGSQMPSVVYVASDGKHRFGSEAERMAIVHPKRAYRQFKRGMRSNPHDSWHGGPSSIELTGMTLGRTWEVIRKTHPEVTDYVPELGGKKPGSLLRILVSHPATYGQNDKKCLQESCKLVGGGFKVDGFVSEPIAAGQRFREEYGQKLKQGDKLAVIDLGGGTTDITISEFQAGLLEQVVAGKGDPELGGIQFTYALYIELSDRVGMAPLSFNPQQGLVVPTDGSRSDEDILRAAMLWSEAEQAKLQLSTSETATRFLQLGSDFCEVEISRTRFRDLADEHGDLYGQLEQCVISAVEGTSLSWSDVENVLVVGGSAGLPGIRELVADATGRQLQDVYVSTDSAHVVSNGCAYQAAEGEETAHVVVRGIGVTLRERDGGSFHKVFVEPGTVCPPSGVRVALRGQEVDAPGGPVKLSIPLVEVKSGVNPKQGQTLTETEIVPLGTMVHEFPNVPSGTHQVEVGFRIDSNGQCLYMLSIEGTGLDCATGRVLDLDVDESPSNNNLKTLDLVLGLDVSGSMQGPKLRAAQDGAHAILAEASLGDTRAALVSFGATTRIDAPLGTPFDHIGLAIEQLSGDGNTPMSQGLELARAALAGSPPEREKLVFLLTDGHPNNESAAMAAADDLKQLATVFCVGVGRDVSQAYLLQLASSPDAFRFVHDAKGIREAVDTFIDKFIHLYVQPGEEATL